MPRQRLIDARARAFDGTAECHTGGDDLGRVQRRLLKLTWLLVLAAVPVLLAGCGEGVSKEEFEAVQTDLQAARSQVQSLEAEKRELQATAVGGSLEELGRALLIDHIMVFHLPSSSSRPIRQASRWSRTSPPHAQLSTASRPPMVRFPSMTPCLREAIRTTTTH